MGNVGDPSLISICLFFFFPPVFLTEFGAKMYRQYNLRMREAVT